MQSQSRYVVQGGGEGLVTNGASSGSTFNGLHNQMHAVNVDGQDEVPFQPELRLQVRKRLAIKLKTSVQTLIDKGVHAYDNADAADHGQDEEKEEERRRKKMKNEDPDLDDDQRLGQIRRSIEVTAESNDPNESEKKEEDERYEARKKLIEQKRLEAVEKRRARQERKEEEEKEQEKKAIGEHFQRRITTLDDPDAFEDIEEQPEPQPVLEEAEVNKSAEEQRPGDLKRLNNESFAEFQKRVKSKKIEAEAEWKKHLDKQDHKRKLQLSIDIVEGKWGTIHSSHRRSIVHDMLFCRNCGLWSETRVNSPRKPCIGQPANSFAKNSQRHMIVGFHPLHGKHKRYWADGKPAECKAGD